MYVQTVIWKEGELEVVIANRDGMAIKMIHSLNDYLTIFVGHMETSNCIEPLWELKCPELGICRLDIWLPNKSTVVVTDNDTIGRLLKKILRLLDETEVVDDVAPLVKRVKEYVEEAIKEVKKNE